MIGYSVRFVISTLELTSQGIFGDSCMPLPVQGLAPIVLRLVVVSGTWGYER